MILLFTPPPYLAALCRSAAREGSDLLAFNFIFSLLTWWSAIAWNSCRDIFSVARRGPSCSTRRNRDGGVTAAFAGPGNVFSPSTVPSLGEMLLLASSVAYGAKIVPALPRWGVQVGDIHRPRGLEGSVGLGKLLEEKVGCQPGAFWLELEDEDDGRRMLLAVGDAPLANPLAPRKQWSSCQPEKAKILEHATQDTSGKCPCYPLGDNVPGAMWWAPPGTVPRALTRRRRPQLTHLRRDKPALRPVFWGADGLMSRSEILVPGNFSADPL